MHFHKFTVTIYDLQGIPLLQGWQDSKGSKLWCFSLRPQNFTPYYAEKYGQAFTVIPKSKSSDLQAFSAYDLPNVEALVRYVHVAAGFPVKSTWLDAIKAGNFASWSGLTYQNASKYCPSYEETIKFNMAQTRHNVRSTKHKPAPKTQPSSKNQALPVSPPALTAEVTNEVHSWETPISKLYSDDTGCFPVRSRSGNQYVMILFHCDRNAILQAPLKKNPKSIAYRRTTPFGAASSPWAIKWTFKFWTTKPAQNINMSSQRNGVHNTNWSPHICIDSIRPSVPSAHIRLALWPP